MSTGASYLTVPITRALPQPPDVKAIENVPGGILIPCGPFAVRTPPNEITNRNRYRLNFPQTQGVTLKIKRIHVKLPVWLGEKELEKHEETTEGQENFKTKLEAEEKIWPNVTGTITKKPISYSTPYELLNTSDEKSIVGSNIVHKTKVKVERSVLPITVQMVARIIGPNGEMWAESFEVPLHYVAGTPGVAVGTGIIESYADLQNELTIDQGSQYSLALFIFIPTNVITNPILGPEEKEGEVAFFSEGEITLFYDVEPTPVGK